VTTNPQTKLSEERRGEEKEKRTAYRPDWAAYRHLCIVCSCCYLFFVDWINVVVTDDCLQTWSSMTLTWQAVTSGVSDSRLSTVCVTLTVWAPLTDVDIISAVSSPTDCAQPTYFQVTADSLASITLGLGMCTHE